MPVPLGRRQATDEGPMGLLTGCHRRIEQFLKILTTVAAKGEGASLEGVEREALGSALRYFREGAPRHTEDEERSLFPRLRAAGDPAAADVLDEIERLEADHVRADELHARVDELGRDWLDRGSLAPEDAAEFRRDVQELELLYRAHIAVEDGRVFPLAGRLLDPATWKEIEQEMSGRRAT